jgi:hypothetical protein
MAEPNDTWQYPDWLEDAIEGEEARVPRRGRSPRARAGAAQRAGARAGRAEGEAAGPGQEQGRVKYCALDVTHAGRRQIRCSVRVARDGAEFEGSAEDADVPALRPRIAARAAVEALSRAADADLALRDASLIQALAEEVVLVGVYGLGRGEVVTLIGASVVRDSVEHAAVLATLQATNRWLGGPADGARDGPRQSRDS